MTDVFTAARKQVDHDMAGFLQRMRDAEPDQLHKQESTQMTDFTKDELVEILRAIEYLIAYEDKIHRAGEHNEETLHFLENLEMKVFNMRFSKICGETK